MTCPACGAPVTKVGAYWMCHRRACDFHMDRAWTDAEIHAPRTPDYPLCAPTVAQERSK